jgi:hypothetical protein
MASHSVSTCFWAHFESALQAYQKTTGVTLARHPFAWQLQNPHSVESITTVLKYEARASSDLLGGDEMINSIECTVSMLFTLSATPSFGDATGLVRKEVLMVFSSSLTGFDSHTHLQKQYLLPSPSFLLYVPFSNFYVGILVTPR